MIPREQLPADAADWKDVVVSFERLALDSAESCPVPEDEIFEYVQMESADTDEAERSGLRFLRTAAVGEVEYWMWEYQESSGQQCYVTCSKKEDGSTCLGLAEPNGLSPEQYMLAEYYNEVYWS